MPIVKRMLLILSLVALNVALLMVRPSSAFAEKQSAGSGLCSTCVNPDGESWECCVADICGSAGMPACDCGGHTDCEN